MATSSRQNNIENSKKPILVKISDDDNCNIDNLTLQSLGAYMLFDEIESESTKGVCEFIIKANYIFPKTHTITILINSPGGDVYDGFGVIDLMETSRLKIQTVAIGMVASMASLIHSAGSPGMRIMTKHAIIMTHQFSSYFEGKYHEVLATREHDDEMHRRLVQHFLRHSKMSEKQIKDVLLGKSDRYITAKEALSFGLCDRIQDPWS